MNHGVRPWERVQTLKEMKYWAETRRSSYQKVLHSKLVFRRRQDGSGSNIKYNVRLVTCGNKEIDNEAKHFYSVPEFSVIKLIVSSAKQHG